MGNGGPIFRTNIVLNPCNDNVVAVLPCKEQRIDRVGRFEERTVNEAQFVFDVEDTPHDSSPGDVVFCT